MEQFSFSLYFVQIFSVHIQLCNLIRNENLVVKHQAGGEWGLGQSNVQVPPSIPEAPGLN